MGVLTHHKKGVRALATHPSEFTFASGSTGSVKQWKCPEGAFMQNFEGHNAIINTMSVNEQNVFFTGVKIWKQDETATEESHPLEWKPTLARRKF
ncbi:hypothetical protein LB505_006878 [Fusarium chuoi]|nr:hypothetical protein LB505_006878 [Fusarium chuoi]